MSLSAYEKRSLIRFLLIYLMSIYTFIVILGYMFYMIEIKNIYETYHFKIRAFASSVSHQIITAHMMGDKKLLECLSHSDINDCFSHSENYAVSLYDKNNKRLYAGFEDEVDLSQKFYNHNDMLFYVDDSPQLHLGIKYIVIKKEHVREEVNALQQKVFLYMLACLALATLLGYILAKLFLKPIKAERDALDKFIKDSTHELNTPITAILMSIETLKDIDPKKKKRIELSGKRIASLYANLSYMLLHDKHNEAKSMVDMKQLIRERIEYFHDVMVYKNLHVSLDLSEKFLHVNQESMIKLIDNLLSNAIKYNIIGGTIEIVLSKEYVSVTDNGIGIAEEKLGDILKRYKRANSDRGGFGIGLDIVNTICKDNHFRLEITSKLNEGSTFRVRF
ncbi:MAG: HAMP domain-containing sensor histidine kinase [Sulfurospirillaceae bacterium]|nr:HAMP domain-containing sensor histidine kinase [Sulfurospirillaceae bacterium]MDD2826696.1 HAMP domain-containing sensor histidine kinase [Sulfurospirillaceae bacterium]